MKILMKGKIELNPHISSASLLQVRTHSVLRQTKNRARRLPGSLVGIHRTHLELVVRTLRRPTGRVLKRHSRRQSEAVPNWPRSHSN